MHNMLASLNHHHSTKSSLIFLLLLIIGQDIRYTVSIVQKRNDIPFYCHAFNYDTE